MYIGSAFSSQKWNRQDTAALQKAIDEVHTPKCLPIFYIPEYLEMMKEMQDKHIFAQMKDTNDFDV